MEQLDILELREFVLQLKGGYKACQQYIKKSDISQGRKLLKLWIHIDNCKEKYTDNQADRMEAHSILFGKNTLYSAKKMQTLTSQLRGIVVKYIRSQVMEESSLGQLALEEAYRKSGLVKLADQALESSIEKANKEGGSMAKLVRSVVYSHQYDVAKRAGNFLESKLEMSDKELDDFYFERKLYSFLKTVSKLRLANKEIKVNLILKIERIFKQIPPNSSALIKVQEKAIRHFIEPNSDNYYLFKEVYFELVDKIEKDADKGNLLIFLVNAIIVLKNIDPVLRMEYVILYKYGFKNNLLAENGKISGIRYDNIIFSAEFVGDYEFIKEVVGHLGHLIDGRKERKRSLLLSKAYELFGEGKFREAIAELRVLEKAKDVPYYFFLRKHLLLLKCLYEQEVHSFDAYVNIKNERDAFYRMLNRYFKEKYIDEDTRDSFDNFYKLLRDIADQENGENTKAKLLKILDDFEGLMVETQWIEKIIAELPKK